MSDELRLPDDLAAMEARLAAQSLPPSGLNRDELMYRAGWAACETQRSASAPPPSQGREQPSTVASGDRAQGGSPLFRTGGIPDAAFTADVSGNAEIALAPLAHPLPSRERGRIAVWSLASAALAASLAVAVTWLVVSPRPTPAPAVPPIAAQPATTTPLDPSPARAPRADAVADYLASLSRGQGAFAGALLVMHRRPDVVEDQRTAATEQISDVAAPTPKTARQLRQELLSPHDPTSAGGAAPAFLWPWNARLFGEST